MIAVAVVSVVAMVSLVGGLWLNGDRRQPRLDSEYSDGTWTPLLNKQPQAIVNPQVEPQFEPGQFTVRSKYPAFFHLGDTPLANYSIRMDIAPAKWDGDAGLFLNFGSSMSRPDEDECLLIGVADRGDGKIGMLFRQWRQNRESRQLPTFQMQFPEAAGAIPIPASGSVKLQVDVAEGRVRAVALNGNSVAIPLELSAANMRQNGMFGVYLLRGSSQCSHPLIRVSTQE
jgi:hypothetical protein